MSMSIRRAFSEGVPSQVWTNENRVSSDSNSKDVILEGLLAGVRELIGRYIQIDGKTKLNGIFKYEPFVPDSKLTTDGFDQTQLYYNLDSIVRYLINMGFDVPSVIRERRGPNFKITAHANGTNALNAWYAPQTGDLTFGTANEKWHLASDGDISLHENGHLIFDHYNPTLSGWDTKEAGAIHEAFGDVVAATFFNDAEMSEDFVPFEGRPENKDDGLRTLNNDLSLSDVSSEVHDRGQVYAGFFWSLKKILEDASGPFKLSSREAADLVLKILVNHASCYTTGKPTSKDFISAVITGINGLANAGQMPVNADLLKKFAIQEGLRRRMIGATDNLEPLKNDFTSMRDLQDYLYLQGVKSTFKKVHAGKFIGGSVEVYQQELITKKAGTVSVEGGYVFVHKDSAGRTISFSADGLLTTKQDEIDEGGNLELSRAVELARSHAELIQRQSLGAMRNFRVTPGMKHPVQKLGQIQVETVASRQDYLKLDQIHRFIKSGRPAKAEYIMLGNNHAPYYVFKVGLSIYYVNTKTEEVLRKKDYYAY